MSDPAVASLLDALRSRGGAPCLQLADETLGADALLGWIEDARAQLQDLAHGLTPGSVLGVRGLDPRARFALPLAAWSLGVHTFFVSEREPEVGLQGLLAQAGCRAYVERSDGGTLSFAAGPGDLVLEGPASTLIRTSGTRGAPKIAVHAVAQHLESARGAAAYLGLTSSDNWLLSLPTSHVGGLGILLRTLQTGALLSVPAFDAPLAGALADLAPTHVSLVATQLRRLLDGEGAAALAACRAVLVGGGPIPPILRMRALQGGVPLVVSYGTTETSALVAASGDPDVVLQPTAAGRPLPERTVRVDADDQVRLGGPTLFQGYLVEGRVEDPRDAEGLFATGDLGRIDDDGVLHVTGRLDRMFISGGENVQPEEVEQLMGELEGVSEAYVVPVPDEEFGHRPAAFVRGAPSLQAEDLAAVLRVMLPGFKVPDAFYVLPSAGPGLKPDLAELERRAAQAQDLKPL